MQLPKITLTEVRQAIVAGVGVIAEGVSIGVFHSTDLKIASGIIAVALALGVSPLVGSAKPVSKPVAAPIPVAPPAV